MNPYAIPEITVDELKARLDAGEALTVLDVRETWEVEMASLGHKSVLVLPMSLLAQQRENAFPPELRDPETPIVVMCHHGVRSADVTRWMLYSGWKNVASLRGGIDEYAHRIDASVGLY